MESEEFLARRREISEGTGIKQLSDELYALLQNGMEGPERAELIRRAQEKMRLWDALQADLDDEERIKVKPLYLYIEKMTRTLQQMTYFVLDCPLLINEKNGGALVDVDNNFKLAGIRLWKKGSRLNPQKVKNIPNPVEIEFQAFQNYKGPPRELMDLGIPLMSKRLADVLVQAGVDNLELFPAVLRNASTGQMYDYYVYNLLGLVPAVDVPMPPSPDLQGSKLETFMDASMNMLTDESKVGGYRMFRLAEYVTVIVVHYTIQDAIESAGIDTLKFINRRVV